MNTANKFLLVWALGLSALLLMGLTIPNTFAPGTTISSAEMNAHFDAVKAAVDVLEAQSTANTAQLSGLSPESGLSPRQLDYARDHGLVASYVEPATGMRFVLIPPGEFWMGASPLEALKDRVAVPQHHVRLTQAFYLSVTEVTNAQYRVYAAGHRSTADGDQQPVTEVNKDDAIAFAAWLSGATGDTYGLPTEAQWEYACRAGTTTAYSFGAEINQAQANVGNDPFPTQPVGLERQTTTDVGIFPANAWGLHDMHGNVWEWCADRPRTYSGNLTSVTVDPNGGPGGGGVRGGAYASSTSNVRSAHRFSYDPTTRIRYAGFRLARPVTP